MFGIFNQKEFQVLSFMFDLNVFGKSIYAKNTNIKQFYEHTKLFACLSAYA